MTKTKKLKQYEYFLNYSYRLIMDLQQNKLTRAEWNSIEEPVSPSELEILKLLIAGFKTPDICTNKTQSLFNYVKIENTPENEYYLYTKYFAPIVDKCMKKYGNELGIKINPSNPSIIQTNQLKKIKSIDQARLQNLDTHVPQTLYEFVLLELATELLKQMYHKKAKYSRCLYTLIHIRTAKITHVNRYVEDFIEQIKKTALETVKLVEVVEYAVDFIEQNKFLSMYQDRALYDHQQNIYRLFGDKTDLMRRLTPKLVLYSAPTGTGKTLTPIGLAEDYRVIFVCVARHIGLALAKSAISVERKIAFAFGSDTAADVRLHYFAASDYQKDKRSGGIRKVNNESGEKVEIMICDVKSYEVAMLYMLAFNPAERIITYWDEPTITLDYEHHSLHDIIHRNWSINRIPNMVLSCATLPKESELVPVLSDFRNKFEGAEIHTITSYDYKKSIPILNKDGYTMVPHRMYSDWLDLQRCIRYCEENLTLLRYFDLGLIVDFLFKIHSNLMKKPVIDEMLNMETYFAEGGIASITMMSLKIYYLRVLRSISEENWSFVLETCVDNKKRETKFFRKTQQDTTKTSSMKRTVSLDSARNAFEPSNGLLITTSDAFTLTDGPTIYLCEDVSKIGNFYLQQSAIPQELMQNVIRIISNNNTLSNSISKLEQILEDMDKDKDKNKSDGSSDIFKKPPEMQKLFKEIEELRKQVKYVSLDPAYIPNTQQHMARWAPKAPVDLLSSFVPTIDEESVREIMSLTMPNDNYLKVLLLLGIGLFMEGVHPMYLEVMKRLATRQQLFMIIASTDYTYGTNYSFCHGFIGKDLSRMTKQKTLQCMGRIGRSSLQQTYTIRFRDDDMLYGLFKEQERNLEAENMCALFCSD